MRTVALGVLLAACGGAGGAADRPAKVYVCAQTVAGVDVIDGTTLQRLAWIPTGDGRMPHNVQVGAGKVFVTNPDMAGAEPDELLVIDPATDEIVERVDLATGAQVAHVVTSPDEETAYVTGWASNRVYRVDLTTMTKLPDVLLPGERHPHGARLSADGRLLYTANSVGSVSEIDAAAGGVTREFALAGPAVQVAVTETAVYATVFDPPELARIDRATGTVEEWPLPDGAAGPAQVALAPDGLTAYVADQGVDQAAGNRLYALDAATGTPLAAIEVGRGAHGVSVTPDGAYAYVTSLFDDGLVVVDLQAEHAVEIARTGKGPNGVALWSP